MDLPKNQSAFDFNEVGASSGRKYEGTFTVVCTLNVGQKYALELEKTRLLANYANPSDGLSGLAHILANLRMKIVDAPEWWKQSKGGMMIEDEEILLALYDKLTDAEYKWREALMKKGEEAAAKNKEAQETQASQ